MPASHGEYELDYLHDYVPGMEEREAGLPQECEEINDMGAENEHEEQLSKRTVHKLDYILLPFLATLFLLNSLDKSNIGNAETAGFTRDAGLSTSDLNTALAFFFAFFVALQPVGAAFGRRYGMARWVPACMSLWGLSTILHIWVHSRYQLILLRIAIASLEAGFYPTAVSYLSLFYTRYEFAVRLGLFYGQTAVAGVLGGILSWAVFSHFPKKSPGPALPPGGSGVAETAQDGGWKSWQVLFLIEGLTTMVVAMVGFFWLPHSADNAWFLKPQERVWAEQRIRLDRDNFTPSQKRRTSMRIHRDTSVNEETDRPSVTFANNAEDDAHHRLLDGDEGGPTVRHRKLSTISTISVTADSGLSRHDILSAVLNYKIWHLLVVNILSAIPATAFGVFLPLVIEQLSPALNLSPATSNLLAAPPFACGAVTLMVFMRWSDKSHQRVVPILGGLGLLLLGLILTVTSPRSNYIFRYISLCILLSGSFIASPLTVAWLTNNTPEPGKRAILLGINGWGNLAGVFSALLFRPEDKDSGYIRPLIVTLICVVASFAGFIAFWVMLVRENKWRTDITATWTKEETEREEILGDVLVPPSVLTSTVHRLGLRAWLERLGWQEGRRGDEKLTFRYGL